MRCVRKVPDHIFYVSFNQCFSIYPNFFHERFHFTKNQANCERSRRLFRLQWPPRATILNEVEHLNRTMETVKHTFVFWGKLLRCCWKESHFCSVLITEERASLIWKYYLTRFRSFRIALSLLFFFVMFCIFHSFLEIYRFNKTNEERLSTKRFLVYRKLTFV